MANETKQKNPETMEEIIYGCKLARQLESNLFNLANQPDMLSRSIDEIVRTFTAAKERVSISHQDLAASFSPMLPHEAFKEEPQQPQMGATFVMQEWVRSSFSQPMDPLIQMQQLQAPIRSTTPFDMRSFLESKMGMEIHKLRHRGTSLQISEMGGRDVEGSERSKGSEGEVQPVEASSLRQRRRKDDAEKKTVMLPANQFGNTEMPPEDGFTWRKYGQKEILGSKYPRSYYRCTHQKLYQCPAKKQVQRVDDNPNCFAVTYRGNHTCHMSSTAPSSVPPRLLLDISQDMTQTISPQLSPSSTSGSRWPQSSMHLSLHGGGGDSIAPAGGDARAGPSTSRYGRDREIDYGVAELADAMFNSGSSSGNSMESLFPLAEEREPGEKKSS